MKAFLLGVGLILVTLTFTNPACCQEKDSTVSQQSAYYDALIIYYAKLRIGAYPQVKAAAATDVSYPETKSNSEATTDATGNTNPGPGKNRGPNIFFKADDNTPPPAFMYTIYESASGKLLEDDVPEADLEVRLRRYSISEAEALTLISNVLRQKGLLSVVDPIEKFSMFRTREAVATDKLNLFGITLRGLTNEGGGAGFTNMAVNGLVDYLVAQVNAEISEAFFIRLKEKLQKNPYLAILFPETLKSLENIKVTDYRQSLSLMRSAYQQDLSLLPDHISLLPYIPSVHDSLVKYPTLTMAFAASRLIANLHEGLEPAEILMRLDTAVFIKDFRGKNNYAAAIATASLLSNSLRDVRVNDPTPEKRGWLTPLQLRAFINEPQLFAFFLADIKLEARKRNIAFDGVRLDVLLAFSDSATTLVSNFMENANLIAATVKKFRDARIANAQVTNPSQVAGLATLYTDLARQLIFIVNNMFDMLPTRAVVHERQIVRTIQQEYLPRLETVNKVIAAIDSKDYNLALHEATELLYMFLDSASIQTYLKYGTFIADVAMAQTSKDVQAAIKSVTLPTGSSRIKKESRFSWGLNAYVGVYRSWNVDPSNHGLPAREWGITAPVGLGANFGSRNGRAGALSVYAGLIDVGAIFAYRVVNDSTVTSDIRLGQLLSPSLGLIWGLPLSRKGYNIPLSLGANFQLGPRLNKVDAKGNSILPALAGRFNVFLAVDIPMINFHVTRR